MQIGQFEGELIWVNASRITKVKEFLQNGF